MSSAKSPHWRLLCPGFIHTNIMDSIRNLPERFDRPSDDRLAAMRSSDMFRFIQERVSHGIDPSYVGELVREGIENDWPYIFTEVEFEPLIDARFAAIKQGFDRIRGREKTRAIESALADLDRRLAVLEAQRGDTHH